jgi:hypothetical protein
VYTQILQYLDEARTHLLAGGSSFAFTMPAGFANFNTPATFLQFNRGMRAKVNLTAIQPAPNDANNAALFAAALTDLGASFIDANAAMAFGAYHSFSTGAGDVANGAYDPTARQLYAHPSYATQAQMKADGVTPDDRFTSKIRHIAPFTRYGFPVEWTFQIYNSGNAPGVVLKNEELLLLRAEANLGLGNAAAALTDINTVRVNSGGLPAITAGAWGALTATQQLDELLYNRKFSLMWENGDQWIDARRYGRLAQLPKDRPGDAIWPHLMIPINECLPRNPEPTQCAVVPTPL